MLPSSRNTTGETSKSCQQNNIYHQYNLKKKKASTNPEENGTGTYIKVCEARCSIMNLERLQFSFDFKLNVHLRTTLHSFRFKYTLKIQLNNNFLL